MKSKILLFLSLITYILTAAATTVTVSSVATGSCTNKKYTFVIKANANGDLDAGSATVTLVSPENTTPTCTFAAVSTTTTPAAEEPAAEEEESAAEEEESAADERRRLATGDFDITCSITSKLDNADIKVKTVVIGTITATVAEGGVAMEGKATCEGTPASSDTTTPDGGKFIQISGFLFLLILTVF